MLDQPRFQEEVLRRQKEQEAKFTNGKIVFCDRGIADGIDYSRIYGFRPDKRLVESSTDRYEGIFLLDRIPNYETESSRKESPELAIKIHTEIERAYREMGYKVFKIPVLSVEQRVELILREVNK